MVPQNHDYCDRLIAGLRDDAAAADPAPAADSGQMEIVDSFAFHAAISDTARDEPATVAQARALLADPQAALAEPELERQVAWLVALADLQHRRADAARCGGTAA